MNAMERTCYQGMEPGDIFVSFHESETWDRNDVLCKEMYLKTKDGSKCLDGSSLLYPKGLRLSINLDRCRDQETFDRPLSQRSEELAEYHQACCIFCRSADPDSNFYRVEQTGTGTIWLRNKGFRSVRLQTADGLMYRVQAGEPQPLTPSNALARIGPWKVLLDVDDGGGPLDIRIRAVHVLDNGAWRQGDVFMYTGDHVDSYYLRVKYQDDCLGVFDSYSSYFLERPALEVLDIDGYGPTQWYVRNVGKWPLELRAAGHDGWMVPPDRDIHPLETLFTMSDWDRGGL